MDEQTPSVLLQTPSWLLTQSAAHAGRIISETFASAGARAYHFRLLATLVEFGPARHGLILGRSWSVTVEGYDGPAPYGQFYRENVSLVGVGLHFTL